MKRWESLEIQSVCLRSINTIMKSLGDRSIFEIFVPDTMMGPCSLGVTLVPDYRSSGNDSNTQSLPRPY